MFKKNDLIYWVHGRTVREALVLATGEHCTSLEGKKHPYWVSTDVMVKKLIGIHRRVDDGSVIYIDGPKADWQPPHHPKCLGSKCDYSGDFGCEYGSSLECDKCKYGVGLKDPEAECNQL